MEWLLIILLVSLYYMIGYLLAWYTGDSTLERIVYFVAFVTGGFAGFACAFLGWLAVEAFVAYGVARRLRAWR